MREKNFDKSIVKKLMVENTKERYLKKDPSFTPWTPLDGQRWKYLSEELKFVN